MFNCYCFTCFFSALAVKLAYIPIPKIGDVTIINTNPTKTTDAQKGNNTIDFIISIIDFIFISSLLLNPLLPEVSLGIP